MKLLKIKVIDGPDINYPYQYYIDNTYILSSSITMEERQANGYIRSVFNRISWIMGY